MKLLYRSPGHISSGRKTENRIINRSTNSSGCVFLSSTKWCVYELSSSVSSSSSASRSAPKFNTRTPEGPPVINSFKCISLSHPPVHHTANATNIGSIEEMKNRSRREFGVDQKHLQNRQIEMQNIEPTEKKTGWIG